jgi:hypothetical protein
MLPSRASTLAYNREPRGSRKISHILVRAGFPTYPQYAGLARASSSQGTSPLRVDVGLTVVFGFAPLDLPC